MSVGSTARATPGGTTFELDRFELVAGERYEIEGRWSGVRGRVFMRPELTLTDGRQSRRLLADLAHKPWHAADGDRWAVAFPCAGGAIDAIDAELTVTPDITVVVKRRRRTSRTRGDSVTQSPDEQLQSGRKSRAEPAAKTGAVSRRRGLGVQLAEAQSELEQMRREQRRLSDRIDAAMRRAEEARTESNRASQLHEQVVAERDDAIRARDDARAERDRATREAADGLKVLQRSRDEALSELAQTRGDLERAQEALQAVAAERDSAIRAGTEVERELHVVIRERQQLLEDRDQLTNQNAILQAEPKRHVEATREVRSDHQQRSAEHGGPVLPTEPLAHPNFSWGEAHKWRRSTHPALRSRAIALLAWTAAIVAVVLVLAAVVH